MAYLSSFFKGTTVNISIPISSLYPSVSIGSWDRCNVVLATEKGGTKTIDKYVTSFDETGIANIELTNDNTNISSGYYYYEIYFQHSDTSEISEWEEEYVIESGRIQVKERV